MLGAALLMLGENPRAEDVRDIDLRRLFEPTEAEREEETTGRISIYDGLRDIDVERAMRDEYDRIENMMFIREKKTDGKGEVLKDPATGEDVGEDDGC
jgi:predicted transcriptional regulator